MPTKPRGNKASLRLKLPDVSKATSAPYHFKFYLNEIGHHIIRHRQLREHSQLFLFQFANTEALERALSDSQINEIVKKAGFSPIQPQEARQAESVYAAYVKNMHSKLLEVDSPRRETNISLSNFIIIIYFV